MERIIKRYRNRKLYDTQDSRYIKSQDLVDYIQKEIGFKIIDNETGNEITQSILMQIILETQSRESVPVDDLKSVISQGGSLFRRAFDKTVQIGRDVAGRIEKDLGSIRSRISSQTDSDRRWFDRDTIRSLITNAGKGVNFVVNEKLRKQLLHLPNLNDVKRIEEKLTIIESHLGIEGKGDTDEA